MIRPLSALELNDTLEGRRSGCFRAIIVLTRSFRVMAQGAPICPADHSSGCAICFQADAKAKGWAPFDS